MPSKRSLPGLLGTEPPAKPARRIPPAVEQRGAPEAADALAHGLPRHHHVARHLQVLVHRLAGDEQMHDLARSLEDQVDAEVAHDPLDGYGLLAAGTERVGGLVAAAPPDLHGIVDDAPATLGVVELRDRGLEADVVATAVRHRATQLRHRLHGEGVRRHGTDLLGDGVVLADGATPLHALARPLTGDLETALPGGDRRDREREPTGVEGDETQLQAFAHLPQYVLVGHADIAEANHAVVDRLQAHEVAAVLDLH